MEPNTPLNNVTDQPAPQSNIEVTPPLASEAPQEHGVFKGRLSRMGYFLAHVYWSLGFLILIIIGLGVSFAGQGNSVANILAYLIGAIAIIYIIAYYVFAIGFVIRRLHDLNQSGLLALLLLVPVVSTIMGIVLLFVPGTVGANTYGPGPQKTHGIRDVSGL